MHITPFTFNIRRQIYSIPGKSLKRDRPLQVLALGISRSGTESLRQALVELGYNDCHHGFRYITDPTEILPWVRLALARQEGNKSRLSAKHFDKVIGDCQAVTDTPSCGFAHEFLDAYPDAKVILNYREDLDAWYKSGYATVEQHYEFPSCLEKRLKAEGRGYLKWKVEDDWKPLCRFLEKPVQRRPFPNGNTPSDYEAKMFQGYSQSRANATRNLSIFTGVVIGTGALLVGLSLW
ncbi:hypothetical protein PRZ48_010782 [Zasmidium cellare]|uniref:P-loop containing nucleoside triphosphate hydrolase protein n=1 Tax=Zasmidium cellare TaxID=395010 RepID=A0ABR0EA64_ZASCE|nr:hypothetical protein PRZ48_010782 [Zasmidium cellare]